jgi:hypothetical protein
MEWRLGGNTADKVDTLWVDVSLIFIGIILFSNGDASKRRTLFT